MIMMFSVRTCSYSVCQHRLPELISLYISVLQWLYILYLTKPDTQVDKIIIYINLLKQMLDNLLNI